MNALLTKCLKKKWPPEDIHNYIGQYEQCYLGCSCNDKIRLGGASGGVVTTLLVNSLRKGLIDGALVCRSEIVNGKCKAFPVIARTEEDLVAAQGSKYVKTDYFPEATKLITAFEGRLGVVGLPCHISALARKIDRNHELNSKIAYKIALFCGHNSESELINSIIKQIERKYDSPVKDIRFRIGHWRGRMLFLLENGRIIDKSFKDFSLYQNLFFYSQKSCLTCGDHFGYNADVCVGDCWSYKWKNDSIKYSTFISRSSAGESLIQNVKKSDLMNVKAIQVEDVLDGQTRSAPFHYNVTARHKAGRLFGVHIPNANKVKVSWHEYIAACIVVLNWKISRKYPKLPLRIPKKLLCVYLYFFKGLQSL